MSAQQWIIDRLQPRAAWRWYPVRLKVWLYLNDQNERGEGT